MPKIKSHKGARKRFKVTSKGKIKRGQAFTSHRKRKKSAKKKRNLRHSKILNAPDAKKIKKVLGEK